MKVSKKKRITIVVISTIFAVLLGVRFVYYNIVIPWPYREGLNACLEKAEKQGTEEEMFAARNVCFRTYPHFN